VWCTEISKDQNCHNDVASEIQIADKQKPGPGRSLVEMYFRSKGKEVIVDAEDCTEI
jgi:hypothetical protein